VSLEIASRLPDAWRAIVVTVTLQEPGYNGAGGSQMGASDQWANRINIDNAILGGKPVIKGTRIPLELIVGALAGGMSIDDVCGEWDITPEDVRAALGYAAEMLAEETVHALPRG
jgi:uncharacterized protein (DUF433 family)